jgi:hypothetical protein
MASSMEKDKKQIIVSKVAPYADKNTFSGGGSSFGEMECE